MKTKLALAVVCLFAVIAPARAADAAASSSLQIHLPGRPSPFPEPLAPGRQPGFKFRGTKGWAWTPAQYLEEIPWLARFKMNFLMNCYVSMFTSTHPWVNEWWKPLPDAKKAAYAEVIHACQTNGITFCFAMNPQLASKRPMNPTNAEDLELLFQHYAWAQNLGVKWFSICVDDVKWTQKPSIVAESDAKMVNSVLARLRENDPAAQMIFCPGPYRGDGTKPSDHAYLQTLAIKMNPDVYVFWVGDDTVTPRISRTAAESYKNAVKHRLFLWDNYPVNDGQPTLHLGPLSGRAADLCEVIDGYIGNPMGLQNEINRIPLATCADYAYNPKAYNPARSIGQAIFILGKTRAQQGVLKELIEAYPGFIATGGGPGANAVREEFKKLSSEPDSKSARTFIQRMEDFSAKLNQEFPGEFDAAKKTVADDLAWMKEGLRQK